MFIQTQDTPNPAVIKFLPGQTLLHEGHRDYTSVDRAAQSPLAQRLFHLTGVAAVFIGRDFLSVTKAQDTEWVMLKPMILGALMEHLATEQPIVLDLKDDDANADPALDPASDRASKEENDPIIEQIKILLEERVRPAVMQDGGDITFDRFEDGVVYLQMRGACAGCPSATMTLKSGVENMLRHYVPEVQEVRSVDAF